MQKHLQTASENRFIVYKDGIEKNTRTMFRKAGFKKKNQTKLSLSRGEDLDVQKNSLNFALVTMATNAPK